ncbi:MAG TPA: hypothetical protein V6D14_06715 [Coleofasciculaceae cyanobacterium]|jgi:hypothetical protein
MKKQTSKVQGYIPKELVRRLKFYCLEQETTLTQALEEAISDWLSEEGAN